MTTETGNKLIGKKTLFFRPFRRVGDKLVVTSYLGWRKIYTANYEGGIVKLLPFPEIKKGETVYAMGKPDGKYNFWHPVKFETLFWPTCKMRHVSYTKEETVFHESVSLFHYSYPIKDDEVYSCLDCDGCPSFSHKTSIYVSEHYADKMHLWEPLTAEIIYEYFEIMRDNLKNIEWYNSKQTKPLNNG